MSYRENQAQDNDKRISESDGGATRVETPVAVTITPSVGITAESLGSASFRKCYGLKYAYVAGAMVCAIASTRLVIAMGKAGMMGYFGTGGLRSNDIEKAIKEIRAQLGEKPFGMNFLHQPSRRIREENLTDLLLKHNVKNIEAAAFMSMTSALVRYRLSGLSAGSDDGVICSNKVMGKVSRPEVAKVFLSPAPDKIVNQLRQSGQITDLQAQLASRVPMADAICVEADSGGHTDMGVAATLMPAMLQLRDQLKKDQGYDQHVFVGSAGGIGTPEAASAAFILGAEFILTGSINQCTVEAGTSAIVKDLLQQMNVQDTAYAPAGDMFEMGAKVQVLQKGSFFPGRANKLYEIYRNHDGIDEIDPKIQRQLEKSCFKKKLDEVYEETKAYYAERNPSQIQFNGQKSKHKMGLIFKSYFAHSLRAAIAGDTDHKVNFQIHTGTALGAFNQWVKGTDLEPWENRRVAHIGEKLMHATATLLNRRFEEMKQSEHGGPGG